MQYGPKIVTNGLVLALDALDRNSYLPNSLINMNNWTVGTGGVTNYNQNGNPATENERFAAANPWGHTGIIWGSFPSGNGNDDGGWNTDWFNIDNTKLYRFSVWVKRTSSTSGGTFYLGMYANGDGSKRMDNSAVEGNAYWSCIGTGGLTQDVWYLYVGHVYPFSTSYTGRHPDTGYYFANNPTKQGDVNGCNIGTGDLKWSSNSTQGIHRTYHYYCGDSTTRLQFYDPRVDLINGKEPSINELVTRSPAVWNDMSGNNNNMVAYGSPSLAKFGIATGFNLDAVGKYFNGTCSNNIATNATLEAWIYPAAAELSAGDRGTVMLLTGGNGLYMSWNKSTQQMSNYWYGHPTEGYHENAAASNRSVWNHWCSVWDNAAGKLYQYTNGVKASADASTVGNAAAGTNLIIGRESNDRQFAGGIGAIRIYNFALTAAQVSQNYNTSKARFGL